MGRKNIPFNKRQDAILSFIEKRKTTSAGEIATVFNEATRVTIVRDLDKLLRLGFIERTGAGRAIRYGISAQYSLIREIDIETYFSTDSDRREIRETFNFDIFSRLEMVFTEAEKEVLNGLNAEYRRKISVIPDDVLRKEIERLNIDFSWKSSKIEGNTYDLLETEQLIKNRRQAEGHTQEEATMILNHKAALEYIRGNRELFRSISLRKIEDIHALLVEDMGITRGLRKSLVRIVGTKYVPIDNEFQIREALEKTCELANRKDDPFEKAVILMLFIAYIQPFIDGNKRTSRLCGNAVLQAFDCCPLSYRSMDELEYKKAILLFYEQNNISYFKKLFLNQFEFAVENYFG